MKKDRYALFWLIAIILSFNFIFGCQKSDDLTQAKRFSEESEALYKRAAEVYGKLILENKDLNRNRFELGKLYYGHGDFKEAADEFKKSDYPQAKKLLAISLFKLANFTDALAIFTAQKFSDDESRYYFALTCEKLNLYDQALGEYQQIQSSQYSKISAERIEAIEKKTARAHIQDIAPEVYQIISNAPDEQKYLQAGALVLLCDEKIEVSAENTQVSNMRYVIKILNERGKENFSETHVEYDSTFEKVELEYARTIKPDGSVVDVGSRHIRDVSKYLNYPLYSNVRVFIISFPEITEGAVVEYKVKVLRSQMINKKDLCMAYPVQDSEPIIEARFSVSMPEERILNMKVINSKYNTFGAKLEPEKKKEDGRVVYKWEFKDIPQILPEANMPPVVEVNPAILISTFASWQDIHRWWWNLVADKVKADEAIKEKVKELVSTLTSDEKKAQAIYNFCAQKIRYVAVEYGQGGYEPHKAEDVFKNKYGDCKDQAILLVTMLREAGVFASSPVLIPTKDYYNLDPDFPTSLFDHCIAAVQLQEKMVFLDPTMETCSFGDLPSGDQDRNVFLCFEKGWRLEHIDFYPAKHNLVKQTIDINIQDDESIACKKSVFTYGAYDRAQRYWLLYTPPQLVEEKLKEKIQDVSIGAELKDYTIDNLNDINTPIVLRYNFSGKEYFVNAGDLRMIPQLANLDTKLTAKDKRLYSIDFSMLDSNQTQLHIRIPAGYSVKYLPDNVDEDNKWIKYSLNYKKQDNSIYFLQNYELKGNVVSQDEYPEFKSLFEGLAKRIKQRIVLEKRIKATKNKL